MKKLTAAETDLWAKKRSHDGQQLWLPLITHLIDTKNVIWWLFNHWLCDGQRHRIQRGLTDQDIEKLVCFLGMSHDIGKISVSFQKKKSFNDLDLDQRLIVQLEKDGFSDLSDVRLSSAGASPHATAGESILLWLGVNQSVAAIVGGHHGKPNKFAQIKRYQIGRYTNNYWQSDNNKELQSHWQNAQRDIFQFGLEVSGYRSAVEIPQVIQPQAILLEGLLIMADWLASSEYLMGDQSKPLFPLIGLDKTWMDINETKRFEFAINNWDMSDHWEPKKILAKNDIYQKTWNFSPRPVQSTVTEAIARTRDPGMVIIEAPMGIGKTEIALVAAEQLAYTSGRNGLFMGLPTQATSNAMFSRVEDWLNKKAKAQNSKLSLRLMHGKAQFNDVYNRLPNAENVNLDEESNGAVVVNSWFTGKKSILTDFVVGTVDHLLLMGLKQKHLFLRHLGLSGKVVIIDEIHSYDEFMGSFMKKTLEWLGVYHIPVIALSATLPKQIRNSYLNAYFKGKYPGKNFGEDLISKDGWQDTEAYPLLSVLDGNKLTQITKFPGESDQYPVTLKITKTVADDNEIIKIVLKK